MNIYRLFVGFIFLSFFCGPLHAEAPSTRLITTLDGEEIPVEVHPAAGGHLFLWFPSEAGPQSADERLAEQLSQQGVEVWRVDLLAARFLPLADSSLLQVPEGDVAAVLSSALTRAKKQNAQQIFIVANGRTAVPVLRGARQWQRDSGDASHFGGVILISPKLFVATPEPGEDAELLPIVAASNLPLYWLQPDQSPWYWKMPAILAAFEAGGSDVFTRVLRHVRDRFYFRPDANVSEDALREQLPHLLLSAARSLNSLPIKNRQAQMLSGVSPMVQPGKKAFMLKVFRGDPVAPALVLNNLSGARISLDDYHGQVVLVNFWASWCPPCVHEMPSMQRLADTLSDAPFEILAVNMAESPAVISGFLQTKVNVHFPILLDRDGATLKRWQVFAFPTSFVIDKSGQVRYALFGAAEWDDPEIIDVLRELLAE